MLLTSSWYEPRKIYRYTLEPLDSLNRKILTTALLITLGALSACSPEEPVEQEISHISDEGPYGGHSIRWYKVHWKTKTTDQRNWCRRQEESTKLLQSCIDANIGWKQGRADPKTNPRRSWKDGPRLDG